MAITALLFSTYLAAHIPATVRGTPDVWFGADVSRVIADMTDPDANQYRTSIHPLFPLIFLPAGQILTRLTGQPYVAAQLLISLSACLTVYLMYSIMRAMGLRARDNGLMLGVFLSSSAFMFWWSVQETFPIGAATLLLPFFLLALKDESLRHWALALTASFAITITNLSAGLIAAWHSRRKVSFGRLILSFLAITLFLAILQKSYLPKTTAFWNLGLLEGEKKFLAKSSMNQLSSLRGRALDMAFYGAVAPPTPLKFSDPNLAAIHHPSLIYEYSARIFRGPHLVPAIAWTLLLGAGIASMALAGWTTLSSAIAIFLGFQFLLHGFYGNQPFLYTAHFTPFLILVSAHGFRPGMGAATLKALRMAAVLFILFALPLNLQAFFKATWMAATF